MSTHYVRLAPYSQKRGALAQRVCIGGQIFEAGKWYELPSSATAALRDLVQGTGAPYFEIVETEATWREIARKELAAKMGGPEAAALAEMFASPSPTKSAPPKKEGEVIPSAFSGLKAKEIDRGETARKVAADLAPTPIALEARVEAAAKAVAEAEDAEDAEGEGPDLAAMTKKELLELADDLGLEVDGKMKKSEIASAVRRAR